MGKQNAYATRASYQHSSTPVAKS